MLRPGSRILVAIVDIYKCWYSTIRFYGIVGQFYADGRIHEGKETNEELYLTLLNDMC